MDKKNINDSLFLFTFVSRHFFPFQLSDEIEYQNLDDDFVLTGCRTTYALSANDFLSYLYKQKDKKFDNFAEQIKNWYKFGDEYIPQNKDVFVHISRNWGELYLKEVAKFDLLFVKNSTIEAFEDDEDNLNLDWEYGFPEMGIWSSKKTSKNSVNQYEEDLGLDSLMKHRTAAKDAIEKLIGANVFEISFVSNDSKYMRWDEWLEKNELKFISFAQRKNLENLIQEEKEQISKIKKASI